MRVPGPAERPHGAPTLPSHLEALNRLGNDHWGMAAGGGLIYSPDLISTGPRSCCSRPFSAFRGPWSEFQTPKAISSPAGKGRSSDGGPLLVSPWRCLTRSIAASPVRLSALPGPLSCPPLGSDLLRPSKTTGVARRLHSANAGLRGRSSAGFHQCANVKQCHC